MNLTYKPLAFWGSVLAVTLLAGCRKEDMAQQPRLSPHQPSAFFGDQNSARPLVEGTVSRESGLSDAYEYTRTTAATQPSAAGDFPANFPREGEPLRRALERGRQRYAIYCSVCHGDTGAGDGMIVQRGFTRPPAYYPIAADAHNNPDHYRREQDLLTAAPGYFYDVITNGHLAMYSYAARVKPVDRWAIAAYVRALQISQAIPTADLPAADRAALDTASKGGPQP